MQSDINGKSGFNNISNLFNDQESNDKGIYCFDFYKEDIVRSEILKFIVGKLEKLQQISSAVKKRVTKQNKSVNTKRSS
jgi:hypothetical protein